MSTDMAGAIRGRGLFFIYSKKPGLMVVLARRGHRADIVLAYFII